MIPWKTLDPTINVDQLNKSSFENPLIIFKHSTRCPVSAMALDRLERTWDMEEMSHASPYFLDLIKHREISNSIAQEWGIDHESPQILVIKNGQCTYHTSHMGIRYQELKNAV
jgi:bacillithiol system protein YtxJ